MTNQPVDYDIHKDLRARNAALSEKEDKRAKYWNRVMFFVGFVAGVAIVTVFYAILMSAV